MTVVTCEPCDAAKDHGDWCDVLKPSQTHCKGCHSTHPATALHCTVCHTSITVPFGLGRKTQAYADKAWDAHVKKCQTKKKGRKGR